MLGNAFPKPLQNTTSKYIGLPLDISYLAMATYLKFEEGVGTLLRENYGIFCSIVVYPVIPKGLILLRLIPTATHSLEDVEVTLEAFAGIREKLENGTYKRFSESVSSAIKAS